MDVVVLNSGASISLASSNVGTNIGFSVLSAWYLTTGQTNYNLDGPINITITKASQTITFNALSAKCSNDAPFALTATASSGLAVTYMSSNTAVATISGNTVTIVGAGSTNITASQAGNGNYFAAADVVQSLTVNASPTITGTLSICGTSGTTQLTGSATAASSNPWVSASTGVATVDNTG